MMFGLLSFVIGPWVSSVLQTSPLQATQQGGGIPWGIWVLIIIIILLVLLWWWLSRRPKEEPPVTPTKTAQTTPPPLGARKMPGESAYAPPPAPAPAAGVPKPVAPPPAPVTPAPVTPASARAAEAPKAVERPVPPPVAPRPVAPPPTPVTPAPVIPASARMAEAPKPVEQPVPPPKPAAPPKPDDLKIIEGIGPKIASLLAAAGITTFNQLASTDVNRLSQIVRDAHLAMSDPTTWPEQARLAAAGDWNGLQKLQDSLKGGRRVK
jgi:predicted flap endonuclease-1-like 5' DNA nuclease